MPFSIDRSAGNLWKVCSVGSFLVAQTSLPLICVWAIIKLFWQHLTSLNRDVFGGFFFNYPFNREMMMVFRCISALKGQQTGDSCGPWQRHHRDAEVWRSLLSSGLVGCLRMGAMARPLSREGWWMEVWAHGWYNLRSSNMAGWKMDCRKRWFEPQEPPFGKGTFHCHVWLPGVSIDIWKVPSMNNSESIH